MPRQVGTYSASWNSLACYRSLASAGSISLRRRLKLPLSNSLPVIVVKRSAWVGSCPFKYSALIDLAVVFANDLPKRFSDLI